MLTSSNCETFTASTNVCWKHACIDHMYALAADMGGIGFISANHATSLRNNALINIHTLEAARMNGASRCLFSSSACVYPDHPQSDADVIPLRELDTYPC